MAVTRFDIQAGVDRDQFVPGRGHMRGFPSRPGESSTATTGVPTDSIAGFAPGALFFNYKATTAPFVYINEGSNTSSSWKPVGGTFGNTGLKLYDTAGDNTTTIKQNSDEAANRVVSIPALGADDTFAMLGQTNAFTGRLTTTDGVSSGTARVVGGRAYTNAAASTAISNTTTETAFSTSYSIPANTLKANTLIKIRYQGIATATNGTDELAVKLYLATDITAGAIVGTTLISHASTDVANNDVFSGEYELIIRTAGASGTVVGAGTYKSIPAAEGTATYKDDILASTTVDTTAAQIVAVSATWSVANAGNSCRLDVLSDVNR